MTFLADILAATLRNATPLVYGTVGETYTERSGVLNLGIEGTMYAGAFFGFAVAFQTGNPLVGLVAAIVVGIIAGAIMGLLTVTLGANQHVSGLGLTIGLIGVSEFANRLIFTGDTLARIEPMPLWDPLAGMGPIGTIADQYGLTYVAFLVVVPVAWWVLAKTPLGLSIRAVGENPEAADVAGISVFRIRYVALMIGGALMAVGGAFITLSMLGTFTSGAGVSSAACSGRSSSRLSSRWACACASRPASRASPTSSCWRCPTWWSSWPWPYPAATCPTPAPT
jgi:ABC-type uncharacterized transport system permease subunit